MFKWHIVYTTDCDKTRKTVDVEAESMTDAIIRSAYQLPRECFIGTNEYAAIVAVIKDDKSQ